MDWRTRLVVIGGDVVIFVCVLAGHRWGDLSGELVVLAAGNLLGSLVPKGAWAAATVSNANPLERPGG